MQMYNENGGKWSWRPIGWTQSRVAAIYVVKEGSKAREGGGESTLML